ncbi:Aste57867_14305 [Aphanomyces stellatus]|uniref:Aste57867_14305 protein n=1 Tax=Aphanomyces stellatus TaxID=120398 RepID=A0A485L204_9STRA|nr:hypothetical protein As57867_014252 [Aphanomyces stellatus]VFT91130.1 Aste57867_14305 [Aphanomyces stellatus]
MTRTLEENPAAETSEATAQPESNNQTSEVQPAAELTTPPVSDKEDEPRTNVAERFELETFTTFSSCHLWRLMSSFYERQGVDSWAQGIVPHFITSNTFIAKRYVQVFTAYLRDAMAHLDPSEPIYIVELGTGSGKFSFYFLQWLHELESIVNLSFPLAQIRYIMTDFTDSNLKFWQTHPALLPYVQRGLLDFAIFDATQDASLYLINAKRTVVPQSLKNPICVVANYLFDTLHHELFRVEAGELKQGFVSVGSTRLEEKDPLDPEIIKRLSNLFRYDAISPEFYPSNPHLNAVLKWYHDYYGQSPATFLVPIGALHAIERLKQLSQNQLLILSGDKGHTNPDHFRGLQDPHIAVHGSFSVMVNYHAVGIYVTHRGGFALHNPQEEASLKVSLFVVPPDAPAPDGPLEELSGRRSLLFPNMCDVYDDTLVSFGPNDFFVMQKSMKEDVKTPGLKGVLALMKLSFYDPDLFYKFRDVFLDQSPGAAAKVKLDVMACLKKTWTHYYQLDKEKDIAFEVGRVYYGMREYEEALLYYTLSLEEMGKHHVTYHNMGLCFYSPRRLEDAMRCFEAATQLNPCYQKASTWLQRVKGELNPELAAPVLPEKTEDPQLVTMQQIDLEVRDMPIAAPPVV